MILFILTAVVIGGLAAALIYYRYRRLLREAKNYERGLKMVSLIIHLPPSSADIEIGTRDTRDVTEETISKAQILYNIISSTATKGFKSKFYGQRHIAFEIVATKGLVHYYAAVPVAMVSVVRQAVVSAYPSATLEEVEEHNIFSPVGKISGTIGGELILKEHYAHPIATFNDTKRDAMQSILNAFSTLGHEDGAAIQLLMRPAKEGWTKTAQNMAKEKRDGKEKKGGIAGTGGWMRQIFEALWKAPEPGDNPQEDKKQPLSSLEQANIDAMEEKTRHPGYESMIRVVASSNTSTRSQAILNNIVASFALFDAPGKNGFKFVPAKDIERFVTSYIFRFFPPEVSSTVLNSVELATVFHLPEQRATPTSQLSRQASKQVDGPSNMAEQGQLLGYNVFRGVKKEVRLSAEDRRRHLYMVGQTGTGKSVLLENLALQDMLDGRGFAFIDPHGDAVDKLISMVPKERTEDIIYFSPADMDYPLGLNLFEFDSPEQKDFLIQEAINMLYKLYDPGHTGIIGPRYEHWFRNAALTLMSDPAGSTFIEIPKIFTDNQYARQKQKHVTDPTVLDFWNKEMAKTTDYHKSEILGWFVSKFGAFMSNEMMRNIIGQTKSSFDLRQTMDEGKILLVNLSKGRTGELNSKLLGMIFVMKFQAAAMSRANAPEDQRPDFSLYVDEFQNFSTDSFATILSEARKYHLNLIVANQFISQLSEEVRDAVFGNVGSVISLRTGANDADFLVKQFSPVFDTEDLVKLPNYNAVVRLMVGGVPSQPFSMATIPPLGHPNPELGTALKRLSAAKYGRPRATVEKEIFERIQSKPTPRARPSPLGQSPGAPGARPRADAPGKPGSKSFLDEWLEKRRAQQKQTPAPSPAVTPAPVPSAPTTQPAPLATPGPAMPPAPLAAPVQAPAAQSPITAPPNQPAPPPTPPNQPPAQQPPVVPPQQQATIPTPATSPAPPAPTQPSPQVVNMPPEPPDTVHPTYAPPVPTKPAIKANKSNIFTPAPGSVVGKKEKTKQPLVLRPEDVIDKKQKPKAVEERLKGPTEFASQMDALKEQLEQKKSELAGSSRDKADVASFASALKDQLKKAPPTPKEAETESAVVEKPPMIDDQAPPPEESIETSPGEVSNKPDVDVSSILSDSDAGEIYIDKDGQIHYDGPPASDKNKKPDIDKLTDTLKKTPPRKPKPAPAKNEPKPVISKPKGVNSPAKPAKKAAAKTAGKPTKTTKPESQSKKNSTKPLKITSPKKKAQPKKPKPNKKASDDESA